MTARCGHLNDKGEPCFKRAGHKPADAHRYLQRATPEQIAEAKRVSDLLHPFGRCTCGGEGACEWCQFLCQSCWGEGSCPEEDPCVPCKGSGWANGVVPPLKTAETRRTR